MNKKIYTVGGYVRDTLLGLKPKDRDYVVVGSSVEEMEKNGFTMVGSDFPVFLHPITKDEYALARTERKNGVGYKGFDVDFNPEITLKEDLFRRDLTINAMAIDESGSIIDYFGGQKDLKNKILKHVSVHFKEDPLRVLRIFRFSSRYNFDIHPSTFDLIEDIRVNNELVNLTNERIVKELLSSLDGDYPENFFKLLSTTNTYSIYPGFNSDNVALAYDNLSRNKNNFKLVNSLNLYKLAMIFLRVENIELDKYKMETEYKNYIKLFKTFKTFNYISETPENKLEFIKRTKAIHGELLYKDLFSHIALYNNYESNFINDNINLLSSHIAKIKSLNYDNIPLKEIGQSIKNQQLNAIKF